MECGNLSVAKLQFLFVVFLDLYVQDCFVYLISRIRNLFSDYSSDLSVNNFPTRKPGKHVWGLLEGKYGREKNSEMNHLPLTDSFSTKTCCPMAINT